MEQIIKFKARKLAAPREKEGADHIYASFNFKPGGAKIINTKWQRREKFSDGLPEF